MQSALDRYTNAFGIIIWRVFSADHTNFFGRIWAIEIRDGRPAYTDLGEGNAPTFSPDGTSIAFLLHAGVEAEWEAP